MERIGIFRNGFRLERDFHLKPVKPRNSGGKRGMITALSPSSARRLRRALLENQGSGQLVGCTLTIPSAMFPGILGKYKGPFAKYMKWYKTAIFNIEAEQSMNKWRRIVNRFCSSCRKYNISGIYRVELQEKGTPHIHSVLWLNGNPLYLVFCFWIDALSCENLYTEKYGTIPSSDLDGVLLHSVLIQDCGESSFSAYRYMASHASKHKQAQLGYQGKQWGFIYRSGLRSAKLLEFDLSEEAYDIVLRCIRRLSHCRVSRGNGGRTDWFTRPETLARMIDYANGVTQGKALIPASRC